MRDYAALITNQHKTAARFVAFVEMLTAALGQNALLLQQLYRYFDVDTAVGQQLDIVGLWVGVPRKVAVPIPNSYFSFDIDGQGWNQANWKGRFDASEGIVILDDETYRQLIRARIASNYWDGTNSDWATIGLSTLGGMIPGQISVPGAPSFGLDEASGITNGLDVGAWVLEMELLGIRCYPIDNFNMTYDVYIFGVVPAPILQLIGRGVFPPKPAGVRLRHVYATGLEAPFFALDYNSEFLAGLDVGAFAIEV